MSSEEADDLGRGLNLVSNAFRPSSPITTKELFAGRTAQLNRLVDVVHQRGQHALVYGERGVGKTSLARVIKDACDGRSCLTSYYTCNSEDTFGLIWQHVLDEIQFMVARSGPGFAPTISYAVEAASAMLGDSEPSVQAVRRLLEALASSAPVVVFIDEFDRPSNDPARTLMADLVKILSDHGCDVTIVLIGVATSVNELIAEHHSIGRSLVQIQMPVMTPEESAEIIEKGMASAELEVQQAFIDKVVSMSQGLPHYTHLVAQHGARYTVERHQSLVKGSYVADAVDLALEDVSGTVRVAYHHAIYSNRTTLHQEVLLACALAKKNAVGEFGSSAVRTELNRITKASYDIPAFSNHLAAFSDPEGARGGVLAKLGSRAAYNYRFVDPLMPPYVMMKGIADNLI